MKNYQKPEYILIQLFDEDILTMSGGIDGDSKNLRRYSFGDLID